jgi:hypothetical protein
MREFRTSGSVGGLGGLPPRPTRRSPYLEGVPGGGDSKGGEPRRGRRGTPFAPTPFLSSRG